MVYIERILFVNGETRRRLGFKKEEQSAANRKLNSLIAYLCGRYLVTRQGAEQEIRSALLCDPICAHSIRESELDV